MKRIVVFALAITLAPAAFAGLSYYFSATSTGAGSGPSFGGRTIVEGKGMRVEVMKGDGLLFKDGSVVLSDDGGQTLHVLDPSRKTYYDLALGDFTGKMQSMFGPGSSMRYSEPKVVTREAGDGGELQGYPTRRSVLDGSFTLTVDAMGQTMAVPISMTIERWATNQIDASYAMTFDGNLGATGDAAFDKAFAALLAPREGFPLKQVTTTRIKFAGHETSTSQTMTISRIRKDTAPPSTFALPAGYTKVASPTTLKHRM